LVPEVNWFVSIHVYVYPALLVLVGLTLLDCFRRKRLRLLAIFLFFCNGLAAAVFLGWFTLARLQGDAMCLWWSAYFIGQLACVGGLDLLSCAGDLKTMPAGSPGRSAVWLSAVGAGVLVCILYGAVDLLTHVLPGNFEPGRKVWIFCMAWATTHITVASALLAFALATVITVAACFSRACLVEFAGCVALAGILLWWYFRRWVFGGVALQGAVPGVAALVASVALLFYWAGLAFRIAAREPKSVRGGVCLALKPLLPLRGKYLALALPAVIVAAGMAYAVSDRLANLDWDFVLHKTMVCAVAAALFAALAHVCGLRSTPSPRVSRMALPAATAALLAATVALEAFGPQLLASIWRTRNLERTLADYAGVSAPYRIVHELRPWRRSGGDFFEYLARNSFLKQDVRPVAVNFVADLHPAAGRKPHIFIMVVDSLRRDYLRPYNKRVNFTPNIEAFSKDAFVFENAFTAYGGTALSEPSIWVGGLFPHKMYVSPFFPMNTLEKLISVNQYRQFIFVDGTLARILKPSPQRIDLAQPGAAREGCRFCSTARLLKTEIIKRRNVTESMFGFFQALDLHLVTLTELGYAPGRRRDEAGFDARWVAVLTAIDRCFGEFVACLKQEKLYDESVIVLTADHGESLGEEGRRGHGRLFPEIVRIPLLMRIPARLRRELWCDRTAPAFLTDLTPSLYRLLGYPVSADNGVLGQALFGEPLKGGERERRRPRLMASGFVVSYGVVAGSGEEMYIVDANEGRDWLYALDLHDSREVQLGAEKRLQYRREIERQIEEVNSFYGIRPTSSQAQRRWGSVDADRRLPR
jgi:hypothetical protein